MLAFCEKIELLSQTDPNFDENKYEFTTNDEDVEYDFITRDDNVVADQAKKIVNLKLNLGTSSLPKFMCANHKCNISMRMTIKKHKHLRKVLRRLSKYAAKVKNNIELIQTHIDNKAKV